MAKPNQFIVFTLDGQKYSLRLSAVERVERAVEITPLPLMPENVLGVVNIRGQIVPVFNVRKRFRLPARDLDARDQLIFARTSRRPVALVVDEVEEIIERDQQDVIPGDRILPGLEYVEGVARLADGLAVIHDLDRFLSVQEENALDQAMSRHD
jgi:purine-binding chemotaxis protein CheW